MNEELRRNVDAKKERLDALRPLSQAALQALQKSYDVHLTYTSNAIEGNTLTWRETAEVIEHGITVAGKPLRDHIEAVDHYQALQWMRECAKKDTAIDEETVRDLHRRMDSAACRKSRACTVRCPGASQVPRLCSQILQKSRN